MPRPMHWVLMIVLAAGATGAGADDKPIQYEEDYDYTKVLVHFGVGKVSMSNHPTAVAALREFRDGYAGAYAKPVGFLQIVPVEQASRLKREAGQEKIGFILSAVIDDFFYSDTVLRYRVTQRMEVRERGRWRTLFSGIAVQGTQPAKFGRPRPPAAPNENPAAKPFLFEVLPMTVTGSTRLDDRTLVDVTVTNRLPFAVDHFTADLLVDPGDGVRPPRFENCTPAAPLDLLLYPQAQMNVTLSMHHPFGLNAPANWKAQNIVGNTAEPAVLAGLTQAVDGDPHEHYFAALAGHLQLNPVARKSFDQTLQPFILKLEQASASAVAETAALVEALDKAAASGRFQLRRDAAQLIGKHYDKHYSPILDDAFAALLPTLGVLEKTSAERWREGTEPIAAEAFVRGRLAAAPGPLKPVDAGSMLMVDAEGNRVYVPRSPRPRRGIASVAANPAAPANPLTPPQPQPQPQPQPAPEPAPAPTDPLIAEADALEAEARAAEEAKDYEKAIDLYDRYVRKYFKKTPRFEEVRAHVEALRKDEMVQVTIQLNRINAAAEKQYQLAEIYYTSGQIDESKQRLELLIKSFPETPWAAKGRELLKKIAEDK